MNGEKKEKMKKFTKMLAFMLALVMIASGLPVTSAYAAETKALKQAFLVTQETASKDAKVLREKVLVVGDKVDFRFNDYRYTNTRSIKHYLEGKYKYINEKITLNEKLENEMILGFRKINGVNKNTFYKKYNKKVEFKILLFLFKSI